MIDVCECVFLVSLEFKINNISLQRFSAERIGNCDQETTYTPTSSSQVRFVRLLCMTYE